MASLAQRFATCEDVGVDVFLFQPGRPCPKACMLHEWQQVLLHVSPWQALSKGLLHVHSSRLVVFFTLAGLAQRSAACRADQCIKVKTWFWLGGFGGVGIDFGIDFSLFFGDFFY